MDNCGRIEFRSALPSLDALTIDFGSARGARSLGTAGVAVESLDATSEHYDRTVEHVQVINDVLAEIWEDIEWAAGGEPEIDSETEHRWRSADDDAEGVEILLIVTHSDDQFELSLHAGEEGLEPADGNEIVSASIEVNEEGEPGTVMIELDLNAVAAAWPSSAASGSVIIRGEIDPDDGTTEVHYDLYEVSDEGEEPESSNTTWIEYADGTGTLEYGFDDAAGLVGHLFVEWDDEGGRADYRAFIDSDLGTLEEIGTGCWDAGAVETFDAFAVFDDEGAFYAELDGEEDACTFGPVERDTMPEDFEGLPNEGEWETIVAESCEVGTEGCPAPFFATE